MGQAKQSPTDRVVKIDPQLNRPPNAEESVPEALVPDVVHMHLRENQSDRDGTNRQSLGPERWRLIQQRAYEIAKARNFEPGAELDDWLQAEREIDAGSGGRTTALAPEDQFTC